MSEINNEKYLNDCVEALANYLNCDKEEIIIEEDEDLLIQSTYKLNEEIYKIAPTEDILDYIKNDLLLDKIDEIESTLKRNGLYDYVEDLDTYAIEDEIFDNLEEHFDSSYSRISLDYNKQTYTIFKL